MKKRINLLITLLTALLVISCSKSEGDDETTEVNPLVGTWKLANDPGSLAVGEGLGNYNWWSISADDINTRSCLFDDSYVLTEDGILQNILGAQTWLEAWQGVSEGCGSPVSPHDGANNGTWVSDETTISVSGRGSFLGLSKVHNSGEDGNPTTPIIYNYNLSSNNTVLELTLQGFQPDNPGATWYFKLKKY